MQGKWKVLGYFCVAMGAAIFSGYAQATVVCSWNIKHLGWGEQKSFRAVAHVANLCDVVAVQEAMDDEGIARLERELEKLDQGWDVIASDAIGRGSYKEQYAFYYRAPVVEYVDGAVVFMDRNDVYAREPFSARFRDEKGRDFALASIHILYGDSVSDRLPEIRRLAGYWAWLKEVYKDTPVVLAGDFNLDPSHEGFSTLRRSTRPLIRSGATTLSSHDGRYANLYDNLWVAKGSSLDISGSGIIRFPSMLKTKKGVGVSHKWARKHVSDHAPVYLTLGEASFGAGRRGAAIQPQGEVRAAPAAGDGARAQVRGNRNSKIYHLPSCPSFSKVGHGNRVAFPSESAARDAGYRKARNC